MSQHLTRTTNRMTRHLGWSRLTAGFGFHLCRQGRELPETWLDYDSPAARASSQPIDVRGRRRSSLEPSGEWVPAFARGSCPGNSGSVCDVAIPGRAGKDRNRLASLSAEGRSSATTVLVASVLRWMHGDELGLEPSSARSWLPGQPAGTRPSVRPLQRLLVCQSDQGRLSWRPLKRLGEWAAQ